MAWHHEGKQFICSHSDGTLTIWNVRSPAKPVQTITPHGKDTSMLKTTQIMIDCCMVWWGGWFCLSFSGWRMLWSFHGTNTVILPEYRVFIWPKADYVVNCKRLNFCLLKIATSCWCICDNVFETSRPQVQVILSIWEWCVSVEGHPELVDPWGLSKHIASSCSVCYIKSM